MQLCRAFCYSTPPSDAATKVGFVGLGSMGSRMATRLMDAGHHLVVHDPNPFAVERVLRAGRRDSGSVVVARESPAAVAQTENVDVVFTMLPNKQTVEDAYLGDHGLFKAPGGVFPTYLVDCSAVDPVTIKGIARAAREVKRRPKAAPSSPIVIDAPVSGGVRAAEMGSISFMVGAKKPAVDAISNYLYNMGRNVIVCGDIGSGQAAQLCNTLIFSASMAAVSESLALGRRLGLDAETLTNVVNASSGRCWSSDTYNPVPGICPGAPSSFGYQGGLPADDVLARLRMALAAAEHANSNVPVAKLALQLYQQIQQEGLGQKDFSSIFRYVYGSGSKSTEWESGQELFSAAAP